MFEILLVLSLSALLGYVAYRLIPLFHAGVDRGIAEARAYEQHAVMQLAALTPKAAATPTGNQPAAGFVSGNVPSVSGV